MTTQTATPGTRLASPDSQPITARLAAAGSRLSELRALLQAARPGASPSELRHLVLVQNVTGKRSSASREKVWEQLKGRYLLDPAVPEYCAFVAAMAAAGPAGQGLAACLMLARVERLLRETTLAIVSPLLAEPARVVTSAAVEDDIRRRVTQARAAWTPTTTRRVQQHLLAALKDFGLIKGSRTRRTLHPRPGAPVALFAARLGQLEGLSDRQVLESRWFRLLGLDRDQASELLYAASRTGILQFRMQAGVVELRLPPVEAA